MITSDYTFETFMGSPTDLSTRQGQIESVSHDFRSFLHRMIVGDNQTGASLPSGAPQPPSLQYHTSDQGNRPLTPAPRNIAPGTPPLEPLNPHNATSSEAQAPGGLVYHICDEFNRPLFGDPSS